MIGGQPTEPKGAVAPFQSISPSGGVIERGWWLAGHTDAQKSLWNQHVSCESRVNCGLV